MAIHPLPVPMSMICRSLAPEYSSVIMSTSPAVSGRGIRVCGVTRRRIPINTASPKTYCSGSPSATRPTMALMRATVASSSKRPGSIMAAVRDTPAASSSMMRAMASASSLPTCGVRLRTMPSRISLTVFIRQI